MAGKIDFKVASQEHIIKELGRRIEQTRLVRNMTQQELANEAGISLRTLQRLEDGENTSLDTLVRIMMGLGIQENLSLLFPDPHIRPVDMVRSTRKAKQRARPKKQQTTPKKWEWGE